MFVPTLLLKKLYTLGSLQNAAPGVQFAVKNRLSDAELIGVRRIAIDGVTVRPEEVTLLLADGRSLAPGEISPESPLAFPLRASLTIQTHEPPLAPGKHEIEIGFDTKPFGKLQFCVDDAIAERVPEGLRIPRDERDDYGEAIIGQRRALLEQVSGVALPHVGRFSFDAHLAQGNCENFIGVAQVPLGLAGPILINGEHAQGEFLVPMATSEGTLIASHNRGSKILNLSGGVKTTVVADAMQRAPVFVFEDARRGREFVDWVQAHLDEIRDQAEATSRIARLLYIDPYVANKFVYLRFNYTTGDGAGQKLSGGRPLRPAAGSSITSRASPTFTSNRTSRPTRRRRRLISCGRAASGSLQRRRSRATC
jgi:hydroxymethylglutaryl-CoA reductase (NADPH)